MAKKSKKSQRRYVPRQTRKFQLRRDHPADIHISEILDYAKSQRREVTIIREGVALWWALENGNLDYLFEKFPQYRQQFQPDTDALIEQFRQLLLQQSTPAAVELGGPKALPVPQFALPLLDEDDDQATLVIKRDTSTDSAMNFFNSMIALQS